MNQANEQLLEKVVAWFNDAIYNQIVRGGCSSTNAVAYGFKKRAYSQVIQEMTGLSEKEVFEKYCKWDKDDLMQKRREYTKSHQEKDWEEQQKKGTVRRLYGHEPSGTFLPKF